jgi:hypothetical protein
MAGSQPWPVLASTLARKLWKLGIFFTAIYSSSGANRKSRKAFRRSAPRLLQPGLVRLSRTSIADEMRIEHTRRVLGE